VADAHSHPGIYGSAGQLLDFPVGDRKPRAFPLAHGLHLRGDLAPDDHLERSDHAGVGVFALAPFLASLAFNFWYWPVAGAQNLRTSWWRFIFARVA